MKREASSSLNGLLQKSTDEDNDEVGPPEKRHCAKKAENFLKNVAENERKVRSNH